MSKKFIIRSISLILILAIVIINSIGIYIGNIFYNKTCKIETRIYKNQQVEVFSRNIFNKEQFNSLLNENIAIRSKYGYMLYGTYIKNNIPTKNTVIIVQGLWGSRWTSLRYADMYLKKGFNVLVYDSRNHGKSGGDDVTFGAYEKYDLDQFVNWLYVENNGGIIGVQAESMGAATALLHSEINEKQKRVKFYISDCAYSDLRQLFILKLAKDYNIDSTFKANFIFFYASIVSLFRSHFWLYSVSPINAVKKSSTPILFIHGAKDEYIPNYMASDMFNVKRGIKELYICPKAGHAMSISVDPKTYKERVYRFIDTVLKTNH